MTFRRVHGVAALLTIAQTTIQAKDPRELTLELLSSRESWSNLKMASRSGARYECSAGEARLASQVTQKKAEDKPATLATLLAALDGQCAKLSQGWWTYEWCHPGVVSRRPAVLRRLHAIDARRLLERRSWVVSFSILRPFGPRDGVPTIVTRDPHAGAIGGTCASSTRRGRRSTRTGR